MKKKIGVALILALGFQCIVLTGMVVSSALPLWTGKQIRVKTVPVDPRSLFRGNYARLAYPFSRVDAEKMPDKNDLRNGEIVYVLLKPGKDDLHEFDRVVLEKPAHGLFLRGRVQSRHQTVRIRYGIEAFFAPKEKALQLEKDLQTEGIAVLMVSKSGKARLKAVVGK